MKIALKSDLHLEFGKFKHTPPECDVVLLAGDIGVGADALPWIERTFLNKNIQVCYLMGNHEYYGRVLEDHRLAMREKCLKRGIHFLDNDVVVINDVRIIGGTLWTDFNLMGNKDLAMLDAASDMNDYRSIERVKGVKLTPKDTEAEHWKTRMFIIEQLRQSFDGKTVVMTHHAPSILSIEGRYKFSPLSNAYASRLEDIILDYNPAIWHHGHTHSSIDSMLGETRIICNPRGYVGHELNPNFDPNLVVEI